MLLGIDIGTTHSKAAVYDRSGKLLSSAKKPTPKGVEDGLEHYLAGELWLVVAELIRTVSQTCHVTIEALAVASMGETGVGLDDRGESCLPVIPWYDQRAQAEMAELRQLLGKQRFFEITGLYPNPIHSVAKWMYLQKHAPKAWQQSKVWLSMGDYISYRLTDVALMTDSQAARTMAYDVFQGQWSPEILSAAGVSAAMLPQVVPAAQLVGHVTLAAGKVTGLKEGTPVFSGGHDHLCACFACGVIEPSTVLDSMGTAESLNTALEYKLSPQAAQGFGIGPHVVKGQMYLMGGIYSSGGAKAWAKELFDLPSYQSLQNLALNIEPGEAPLFIAHFHGAAPPWNKETKGAFVDLQTKHGVAAMIRAVYEGLAFEFKLGLEALERVTSQKLKRLCIVGLAPEDRLSGLLRAAIYQQPLEIARYDDMVTLGAALLAGVGANVYDSYQAAVKETYQLRAVIEADPAWQESYERVYPRYKSAAFALLERTP